MILVGVNGNTQNRLSETRSAEKAFVALCCVGHDLGRLLYSVAASRKPADLVGETNLVSNEPRHLVCYVETGAKVAEKGFYEPMCCIFLFSGKPLN